ncbi:MAG: hypothetical protein ABI690_19690 [Chloroflexota bacterium]
MKSKRTRAFRQHYDALPAAIQKQAKKAFALFRANPIHPSLNFKSVGGDPVWYSARIGISYRALCFRSDDGNYIWFWIGPHPDYDSLLKQR